MILSQNENTILSKQHIYNTRPVDRVDNQPAGHCHSSWTRTIHATVVRTNVHAAELTRWRSTCSVYTWCSQYLLECLLCLQCLVIGLQVWTSACLVPKRSSKYWSRVVAKVLSTDSHCHTHHVYGRCRLQYCTMALFCRNMGIDGARQIFQPC